MAITLPPASSLAFPPVPPGSNSADHSALLNLKPGNHQFKFVVDEQWKTSRYLPSATDADGNLINCLQVYRPTVSSSPPTMKSNIPVSDEADEWTSEIPANLLLYASDDDDDDDDADSSMENNTSSSTTHNKHPIQNEPSPSYTSPSPGSTKPSTTTSNTSNNKPQTSPPPQQQQQQQQQQQHSSHPTKYPVLPPPPPPALPAQLEKGVLNQAVLIQPGSGDDNSILPRPDHSVIDHLAASPISKGLLSVGVTKRYKRKYVTTVFYKSVPSPAS